MLEKIEKRIKTVNNSQWINLWLSLKIEVVYANTYTFKTIQTRLYNVDAFRLNWILITVSII